MTLANKLLLWVGGAVVIAIAVIATGHYLAWTRAVAFCDDLAPGTEIARVNEVMSRLGERPGIAKVIDRRPDYVSVVFG